MEDYDDVTAGPDQNGTLNLSFNSWPKVPYEVFTFSNKLISLNLSNNKLDVLTSDFGSLFLLQELNVSYNRIQRIDESIAQCVRLRMFNVSNNELVCLPDALFQCVLMECLFCQNNKIQEISNSIGDLPMLSALNISNNNLKCLPTALSSMAMLKVLQCHGNEELSTSIPSYLLHDDSKNKKTDMSTILWVLKLQKDYNDQIELKTKIYQELEKSSIDTEEMILRGQAHFNELKDEMDKLKESHPRSHIKRKKAVVGWLNRWYQRWVNVGNINKST